jgi:hypothetical protein
MKYSMLLFVPVLLLFGFSYSESESLAAKSRLVSSLQNEVDEHQRRSFLLDDIVAELKRQRALKNQWWQDYEKKHCNQD